MMHRAICMQGKRASRLFYGSGAVTRRGATPQITLQLLQDHGSVQLLDGPARRRRKALPGAIGGRLDVYRGVDGGGDPRLLLRTGWRAVTDANGVDLSRIPAYPLAGTTVRFATEDEPPAAISD